VPPASVPQRHAEFLRRAIEILENDLRVARVAVGGSHLAGTMDEFSDLDLIVGVRAEHFDDVMGERRAIAAMLGPLLSSFTGEHVGEPRLLICLYGPELLHVDLKFVSVAEGEPVGEDPVPPPNEQWIEDRFWTWVHYGATKIGRGELFEAVDFLAFLRFVVLGPLALHRAGARATGVRKIETVVPDFARELEKTIARYDAADCARALTECVRLYRSLRGDVSRNGAEDAAMVYLDQIRTRVEGRR
jgi:predicted nucleotidyltransferase